MRAVAIAADAELAETVRAGLIEAMGDATVVSASRDLGGDDDLAVAVVHALGDPAEVVRESVARLPAKARLVVVVADGAPGPMLAALRANDRVAAVIAASGVRADVVSSVARRVSDGGVFGLEALLPPGTEVHSVLVGSYGDKLACLDQLERFAETRKIRGKYRESILQCADEMLMNALYVAPREAASSGRLAASQATKASIAERARRGVQARWAYTNRTLYLSVRDTYGSLERGALLRSLGQAIAAGSADAVSRGLGLYIMSHGSTSVTFNQLPGVATECICSFDTTAAKLQLEHLGLFEETDDARAAEVEKATLESMLPMELGAVQEQRHGMWLVVALVAVVVVLTIAVLATR